MEINKSVCTLSSAVYHRPLSHHLSQPGLWFDTFVCGETLWPWLLKYATNLSSYSNPGWHREANPWVTISQVAEWASSSVPSLDTQRNTGPERDISIPMLQSYQWHFRSSTLMNWELVLIGGGPGLWLCFLVTFIYADQSLRELCRARLSRRGLESWHDYVTYKMVGPWRNQVTSLGSVSMMKDESKNTSCNCDQGSSHKDIDLITYNTLLVNLLYENH